MQRGGWHLDRHRAEKVVHGSACARIAAYRVGGNIEDGEEHVLKVPVNEREGDGCERDVGREL